MYLKEVNVKVSTPKVPKVHVLLFGVVIIFILAKYMAIGRIGPEIRVSLT
jgi:hypothetical protein